MNQQQSQLDLEIIQRLSQAARMRTSPVEPPEDLVEYDWTVPAHFTREQKSKLDEFAAQLSPSICEVLRALFRSKVEMQVSSVGEHYAGQLRSSVQEPAEFYVELLAGDRVCGFMSLSAAKAFGWVGRLLGAQSSSEDADREMSSLEGAILLDIFSALSKVLSESLQAGLGSALGSGTELFRACCGLDESDAEEYCKISFGDADSEEQPFFCLAILSTFLEPVTGEAKAQTTGGRSADDIRKDMLNHLVQVQVEATVYLGRAFVKVRNITDLQPGDVLLTERKVDEAVEVFVQDKMVFSGFLATCQGQYALRVAQLARA